MTQYKSFDGSKRKLQKLFEEQQKNASFIEDNLKKINLDFTSNNYVKPFQKIFQSQETALESFGFFEYEFAIPEIFLNTIKPFIYVSLPNGWDLNNILFSSSEANTKRLAGQLRLNDLLLTEYYYRYWWVKKSENFYVLSIGFSINLQYVSSISEFGFSAEFLPFILNVDLIRDDYRNYNEIQSGK